MSPASEKGGGLPTVRLTPEIASRYVRDLKKELATKTATEVSYRAPLKRMIEAMTRGRILAQIESRGRGDIGLVLAGGGGGGGPPGRRGTIETKAIGRAGSPATRLARLARANAPQLKRYLESEQRMIFTNYIEFAMLELDPRTGEIELRDRVELIAPKNFESRRTDYGAINRQELESLFNAFILGMAGTKPITTQKSLACHLADSARELSEGVVGQMRRLVLSKRGQVDNLADPVYVFYRQYRHLTRTEDPQEIANAFGQTVSCGLFLAKLNAHLCRAKFRLTQGTVAASIPESVPVIRELFSYIGSPGLPEGISRHIGRIIDTLEQADLDRIRGESPDVFLYFYEEFLMAFDRTTRRQMGVYYTPTEVVNYICEKVNLLLKDEFGRSFGFGDANIRTLDPATGTGTFLVRAIDLAIGENSHGGGGGSVQDRLALENFIGFEILVPPYIIAHMKVLSLLKRMGRGQKASIYLTNTLGSTEDIEVDLLGALAQEVKRASEVKGKTPIMVVIGNPPWSAINKTRMDDGFIGEKMESYRQISVPGMHSLGDPYVKFIRFAQHKIEQNGNGVVGMIVNNSFLTDMGFEGMRRSLAGAFDKIMIYNLHGNVKVDKGDENVFDITTPNAIVIMVRLPRGLSGESAACAIEYDEIKGSRADKFEALKGGNNDWKAIHPENTGQFLFVPHKGDRAYEGWIALDQIFHEHFTGSNTHRDDFVTAFDQETIKDRIGDFMSEYITDAELTAKYGLRANWKLGDIRKHRARARREGFRAALVREYSYRPFDLRVAYFSQHVMGARRSQYDDVRDTPSICVPRSSDSEPWSAVHIAHGMADIKFCEYKIPSHMFPLRLRSQHGYGTKLSGGEGADAGARLDYNFSVRFIHFLARKYRNRVGGEDAFYYIYAVLHSPLYRQRYTGHLQHGFPRIPFVNERDGEYGDAELLLEVSRLGRELADYHRMAKTAQLQDSGIEWVKGDRETGKTLAHDDGRVVTVRFRGYTITNIPSGIWNYDIGSRMVLKEVLKGFRLKGKIALADRQHFMHVCGSIAKTIEIQKKLDALLRERLSKNATSGELEL